MDRRISVANWMPLASAIVPACFVAAYMLGGLIGEEKLGRPSSTAAIGYLFVPVYSFIVGVIGLGVGFLLRLFLRKSGERNLMSPSSFFLRLAVVVVAVSGIGVWLALDSVVAYEKANAAQIIRDSGYFAKVKLNRDNVPSVTKRSLSNWTFQQPNQPPFVWNTKQYTVRVTDSTLMTIGIESQAHTIKHDFRGRTYLTEIEALPVKWSQKQPEYLAVLARLRATSFRSMLLIYDPNGSLLYEELLERCGPKEHQYMGTVNDLDGPALVVNVCEPFKLTLKQRPNNTLQPTSALTRRRG